MPAFCLQLDSNDHPYTMLRFWVVVLAIAEAHCAALTAPESNGLLYYTPAAKHTVSFTERALVIDGTPALMLSGAVHYTRVHEEEWERVFELAVEMGLNCIQTYVRNKRKKPSITSNSS